MIGLVQRVGRGLTAVPRRVGRRPLLLSVSAGAGLCAASQLGPAEAMRAADQKEPEVRSGAASSAGGNAASDKHWSKVEPGQSFEFSLGKHERAHVMQLLSKRKPTSVCPGVACCPKASAKAAGKRQRGEE
jgi:hypothetical protein